MVLGNAPPLLVGDVFPLFGQTRMWIEGSSIMMLTEGKAIVEIVVGVRVNYREMAGDRDLC